MGKETPQLPLDQQQLAPVAVSGLQDIEQANSAQSTAEASILHSANLVVQFNALEGSELEEAVGAHLQGVIDESLSEGADKAGVDAKLRTELFMFVHSGVGVEGEAPVQPTFLSRLDYGALQFGVVTGNQERIDKAEYNITTTTGVVKRDMFSYQDVITDEAEKEQALNYTLESQSADKYARAIAKELVANGSKNIDAARARIRGIFDRIAETLPDAINAELSPFAASDSWINWDVAKQKYLSEHPPQTDAEHEDRAPYIGMGIEQDPLEAEAGKFSSSAEYVQRSIAERHIGWEIQQMARKGIDMSWLTSQNEAAAVILNGAVKEDGQLHSWQYVELGRVTRDLAKYLSRYPIAVPGDTRRDH